MNKLNDKDPFNNKIYSKHVCELLNDTLKTFLKILFEIQRERNRQKIYSIHWFTSLMST